MTKRAALTLAFLVAVPLALLAPSAAAADDVPFTFDAPTSVEVEYGSSWTFTGSTSWEFVFYGPVTTVKSQTPDFPDPTFYSYYDQTNTATGKVVFSTATERPPLAAGTYPLDITLDTTGYGDIARHARATGATLRVLPAALTSSAAVEVDATAAGGVIVSGSLTGDFVDFSGQTAYAPSAPILPAGVWTFVVTDAAGTTVLEKTVDDAAGGPPAVSFYWDAAEPGADYAATATFAVDPEAAGNFAVTAAAPTAFRSDVPARPVPVAEAPGSTPAPPEVGVSVPAAVVLAAAVTLVALLVAIVVLLVRGRRPKVDSSPATGQLSLEGESR